MTRVKKTVEQIQKDIDEIRILETYLGSTESSVCIGWLGIGNTEDWCISMGPNGDSLNDDSPKKDAVLTDMLLAIFEDRIVPVLRGRLEELQKRVGITHISRREK